MLWNPFQFQFTATYVRDEGSHAVIELRKGTNIESIYFPKSLLPSGLSIGESFALELKDALAAKESEISTLKQLLSELTK